MNSNPTDRQMRGGGGGGGANPTIARCDEFKSVSDTSESTAGYFSDLEIQMLLLIHSFILNE